MIDPGLFLAFVLAVAVLMLTPGPNVALIVGNSVAFGSRYGLLTVAGTSSAMAAQIALAAFGMAGLLAGAGLLVRRDPLGRRRLSHIPRRRPMAGADPRFVAGFRPRRIAPQDFRPRGDRGLDQSQDAVFPRRVFPQFVDPDRAIGPQMAILSATFLAIVCTVDVGWALTAGRARRLFAKRARTQNRISGALLIVAAIGLAFARGK